ncbi:hypothetical protein [Methylobacterium sp. D48H]
MAAPDPTKPFRQSPSHPGSSHSSAVWKFQLELISYPRIGFTEEERQDHFMLIRFKDHFVDWISVGQRRKIVILFWASNLLLAQFWITLVLYIFIRHGIVGENQLTLWKPVFLGMAVT